MYKIINISLIILLFIISACSSIPKNTLSSCSIFNEKYLWYKHAKRTEDKWGTPIHIQLAIIKWSPIFIGLPNHQNKNYLK